MVVFRVIIGVIFFDDLDQHGFVIAVDFSVTFLRKKFYCYVGIPDTIGTSHH